MLRVPSGWRAMPLSRFQSCVPGKVTGPCVAPGVPGLEMLRRITSLEYAAAAMIRPDVALEAVHALDREASFLRPIRRDELLDVGGRRRGAEQVGPEMTLSVSPQ